MYHWTDRLRIWEAAPLSTTPNSFEIAITQIVSILGVACVCYLILSAIDQKIIAKMVVIIAAFGCVGSALEVVKCLL